MNSQSSMLKPKSLTKYTKTLAVLSFLGAAAAFYLILLHYKPELSSICEINALFSCDTVNKSTYSELFGIPVSILGFFYYLAMFIFSLVFSYKPKLFTKIDLKDLFTAISFITAIGIAFTIYLTYHEAFTIKAYCLFCVFQQIIILIMGGVLWKIYKKL